MSSSSSEAFFQSISHNDRDDQIEEVIVIRSSSSLNEVFHTRWIHFILGCCILLPWNVMITATPYYLSRLGDSPWKMTFISYLSVVFTASRFVFLARATAVAKNTSPSRQVRRCLIWLIILCFLLTMTTYFRFSSNTFAALILVMGAAQAATDSYLQTSVVAVASLYGSQALQAMMSGQAAIAVVVSAVQVLSSALFIWKSNLEPHTITEVVSQAPVDTDSATRVFFLLATLFLVLSAFAHNTLVSNITYKTVVAPLEHTSESQRRLDGPRQPLLSLIQREGYSSEWHQILRVARTNLTFEVAVAYVFIVTLAVFPAITASVQPTNPAIHPILFTELHFLVYNTGDFLGRYLCSIPTLVIWSANWLATLSFSRTLFIPLFLMCNVQSPTPGLPTISVINSDLLFMLILLAFGVSNGYVSSLCMMSAPSLDHNPRLKDRKEDVDVAATIANFSLAFGLAMGSVASFAVMSAVCGCNPFVNV